MKITRKHLFINLSIFIICCLGIVYAWKRPLYSHAQVCDVNMCCDRSLFQVRTVDTGVEARNEAEGGGESSCHVFSTKQNTDDPFTGALLDPDLNEKHFTAVIQGVYLQYSGTGHKDNHQLNLSGAHVDILSYDGTRGLVTFNVTACLLDENGDDPYDAQVRFALIGYK